MSVENAFFSDNNFIEVKFTHYTIHPFKVYNLIAFSIFIELGNHYHNQFWNIFITPETIHTF